MVANCVYWRRASGASKRLFATIKSIIDAVKFLIQYSYCHFNVIMCRIDIHTCIFLTRIIQSLYYAPAGRYINAWMNSLKKSVKPEIVNHYDLWILRHKIGGAKVFVNNVQWSDQMM